MTDKEEMTGTLTDVLNRVLYNIEMVEETMRDKMQEEHKKIDDQYQKWIDEIRSQRKAAREQLSTETMPKHAQLDEQRSEVKSILEKVQSKTLDDDEIKQFTEKYKKVKESPIKPARVEFIPIKEILPVFGKVEGKAYSSESPSNAKSEIVCNALVHFSFEVTINIKDKFGCFCINVKPDIKATLRPCIGDLAVGKISSKKYGSYIASFETRQAGKAEVEVFMGGKPIMGSPCSIIVFTKGYLKISCSKEMKFKDCELSDVAISQGGRWALADKSNNCVNVYKTLADSDKPTELRGLCDPISIAFDNNELYVVADNHDGGYIHKFNTDGQYVTSFGKYGGYSPTEGRLLKFPLSIAAHNGKLYVADSKNKRIAVFMNDGQYHSTVGGEDKLVEPRVVAVNSKDNLLLVADNSRDIVTYTLDGNYEENKSFTPSKDGKSMINLQSVAVDADGLVLVYSNRSVLIFDCTGNFIHCFDCMPANSIAVSPNRSIYVSSKEGVQVWSWP